MCWYNTFSMDSWVRYDTSTWLVKQLIKNTGLTWLPEQNLSNFWEVVLWGNILLAEGFFLSYHWMTTSFMWFLERNSFSDGMPAWDITSAGYQVRPFLVKTGPPCVTPGTTSSDLLSPVKLDASSSSASEIVLFL